MVSLVATASLAAEIELRAQAQAAGSIVTLADIASVHGQGADTISKLELVPAPATGRTRSLKSREVQDLLSLQGVKLVEHQFSGATNVQISGSGASSNTTPALKATRSVREQMNARAVRAIQRHLHQVADDRVTWDVIVELNDEQLNSLANRGEILANGGSDPWTGRQQFTLQVNTTKGIVRTAVMADVRLPDMVVVARRPFRRGEVVRAGDVELQMPQSSADQVVLATRLEDVVGRETLRSVATGQPIETTWVRKPVMVRRGEIVTVSAKAAGVVVRTQARAAEDGGHDDVIAVERLDSRQRFTARVIGVQELEVFVGAVKVTSQAEQKPATR
jgi:flagella basal body P-ring formation protein FlgA